LSLRDTGRRAAGATHVNTTAFHALPSDDVPLREETLPIHDIGVTLRGYQIKTAVQQPEGRKLDVRMQNGHSELTVPRLDVHSIIVIELE
jgi:hypothetical protein